MAFLKIEENIIFPERDDLIFTHFYLQTKKREIESSPKDISLLVELYKQGGYSNKEQQEAFFLKCIEKNYKKTIQSIRNTLNKYTEKGILVKPKNSQRYIDEDFSPAYQDNKIGVIYKMTHN